MIDINEKLLNKCVGMANMMIEKGMSVGDVSLEDLSMTLYKIEREREEKTAKSDSMIDYNDEIVSIEYVGEKETVDISVTGDNLFFCNDILTKNSIGLPATCDFMIGLISSEELEELGQIMGKQLKNRWGDLGYYRRFVMGIDRPKMRVFNAEPSAQEDLMVDAQDMKKQKNSGRKDDISVMDKGDFARKMEDRKLDFGDFT